MGLMRTGNDQWELLRQQAGIWGLSVGGASDPAAAAAAVVEAPPVLMLPPEAVAALAALTEVNGLFSPPTAVTALPPPPEATQVPPASAPLPTFTPRMPPVTRPSSLLGSRPASLPTLGSAPSPVTVPAPSRTHIPAAAVSRESLGLRVDARAPVKQLKAAGNGIRPLKNLPPPAVSLAGPHHPPQSSPDQPWELSAAVRSADRVGAGAGRGVEAEETGTPPEAEETGTTPEAEETGTPPVPPPPIDFFDDGEEEEGDEDAAAADEWYVTFWLDVPPPPFRTPLPSCCVGAIAAHNVCRARVILSDTRKARADFKFYGRFPP